MKSFFHFVFSFSPTRFHQVLFVSRVPTRLLSFFATSSYKPHTPTPP